MCVLWSQRPVARSLLYSSNAFSLTPHILETTGQRHSEQQRQYPVATSRVVCIETQGTLGAVASRHQDRVSPNSQMPVSLGSLHSSEDVPVEMEDVGVSIRVDEGNAILFSVRY